jgi:hypothetical protein
MNSVKDNWTAAQPEFRCGEKAMKAMRIALLIALIVVPSSSFAWSRGRAVVVRPGFPSRAVVVGPGFANRGVFVRPGFAGGVPFVRPGFGNRVVVRPGFPARFVAPAFVGGVATGLVLNPFFFPRSFYFPGPFIYYYPPSRVLASGYYPPSYSYEIAPPPETAPPAPSTPAPSDAYDRGYSEGYARGYEEAQKEREKERYEEGKTRGYEEGYEAGKEVHSP